MSVSSDFSPSATIASKAIARSVMVLALLVLVGGWGLGIDILVRVVPGFAAMVPSTASCFLVVALALLLRLNGHRLAPAVCRAAAAFVAAVAIADLAILISGAGSGIDRLLWRASDRFRTDSMAAATATSFLLASACLATIGRRTPFQRRTYAVAATGGLAFSGTALVGYAFDAQALYAVFVFTAMALHTAVAFALVFAAFLLAPPRPGWIAVLTGDGAGSRTARRLLPIVVVANLILCLAALAGTEAGLFGPNFRLSLLAIAMVGLSTAALVHNGFVENTISERLHAVLADLEATARDKDLLLREVNHRVKNNLQQINAMISMERRRLADPAGREALGALARRVHALGLVHQKLLQGPRVSEVAIADFLRSLAEDTARGYDLRSRGIVLSVRSDDRTTMRLDVAVSLGLLVNELVVNAIKHAFPDGGGRVDVAFVRRTSGEFELTVADDGIGMHSEPSEQRAMSVGMRIVRSLVRQLRAEATTEVAGGTRWRVIIPPDINEEGRYV